MTQSMTDPSLKALALDNLDLQQLFDRMKILPSPLPSTWTQSRGYGLERLLHEAFRRTGLDVRAPFSTKGEQMDGAFVLDHRHFIYEAKWRSKDTTRADVVAFQAKINRRLVGTLGVFCSVNGFVDDITEYVARGNQLNTLLVDGENLEYGLAHGMDVMIRNKVVAAAQDGLIYYKEAQLEAVSALKVPPLQSQAPAAKSTVVVTEGPQDASVIELLAKRVSRLYSTPLDVSVIAAYGFAQAFDLGEAVMTRLALGKRLVVVVDGDELGAEELRASRTTALVRGDQVVVAEPTLEAWFGVDRKMRGNAQALLMSAVETVDISRLRLAHPEFDRLVRALLHEEVPSPVDAAV
ncbi:restriction endonuclease [Arthrobacter sp. CAN_A1]|uniref:restriction endonuclease n=1 Tax=Arthrobacter sp. CAN_A1 TaxID=2787717 RepID=UPI0018CA8692